MWFQMLLPFPYCSRQLGTVFWDVLDLGPIASLFVYCWQSATDLGQKQLRAAAGMPLIIF